MDSRPDTELIDKANRLLGERYLQKRKLQQATAEYRRRSRRIARDYFQKIVSKALSRSGIDQSEILNRQTEHDLADLKFIESLQPIFAENARQTNERTQELIAGLKLKYQLRNPPNLPTGAQIFGLPTAEPIFELLTTAYSINFDPSGFGVFEPPLQHASSSIAPFENIIQLEAPSQSHSHVAVASFPWTPPRSGQLSLLSAVALNGSSYYVTNHSCDGETGINLQGEAGIWVIDPAAALPPDPCDEQYFVNIDDDWTAGCSSHLRTQLWDQPLFLHGPDSTMVQGGSTVIIQVLIGVYSGGDNVVSDLDFINNGKSINVTGVFLRLD